MIMGKSGYGTSPRLHTANPQQSRAGAAWEASKAASGILTLQWWGAGARWQDPFLRYSQVLAELSDLSQELKGILFGFKIFSLFDFLKIRYHTHKTTPPKIKR